MVGYSRLCTMVCRLVFTIFYDMLWSVYVLIGIDWSPIGLCSIQSSILKQLSFYLLDGNIRGMNGAVIGWTEKGTVGSEVCVEVDLRSSKKEERRIRFIVDGKIQKCVIVGVGNESRYGVCNNTHIFFFYYHMFCY